MVNKLAPFFLISILMVCLSVQISAQNLVPNPNFENYSSCPVTISQLNLAVPWVTPTVATPDYFNSCATNISIDVPTNFGGGGYQFPLNGNGYAGCYFKGPNNYREYLNIHLPAPLQRDICYHMGFFMNLLNQYCGVNQAGMYVSVVGPSSLSPMVLLLEPQITGNGGFYSDTVAWVEISGEYTAHGGEQFVTIGNFKPDTETFYDPSCQPPSNYSYYYIDSVYIIPLGPAEILPLELGPPVEACIEYEINGESGDVMYTWSNGSHSPTTTVTTSGTYVLTITQGCAIGVDSVDVTIISSTPVEINPDVLTICEGASYTITLDPDAGDYIWNDGTTGNAYTITGPGIYSVTLDDGCAISSDQITVDVILNPLPVNLGSDTILCEGDEFDIILHPGVNTVEWQDGSQMSTYTIADPGTYTVTISNTCGEVTDDIEVTGLQVPQIDLGPDTLILCHGDVIHFDFDPGIGEFLWSDDSNDPFFFIFSSGVYSVTVSNACGTTDDMVTVIEAMQPIIGLGDTINLCISAFPFPLAVEATSAIDDIFWSSGETTAQISVSFPGEYAVTVSNDCYFVSDTVYLDIIPVPVLAFADTHAICVGDTFLLDPGISAATYLWQDSSTFPTLEVTGPGLYAVTVTTACGVDHDSTMVTAFSIPDIPDLGPDVSLCPGEQITLFANTENVSFLWNDMSSADSLLVTTPGVYSVTVHDQCITAADTILITSNNSPPAVDLPSSLMLCQGQSVMIDANVTGVNYAWSDGTTNPSLSVTVPGSYSLTVSNTCGTDADTVEVIDAGTLPLIELGSDIKLCAGESQIISPDFTSADSWMWQDGSTNPTFLVNAAGQITIEVSNVCGSAYDTVNASVIPGIPLLNLGNDTSLCTSDMLLLEVNIPGVDITWFDGSHDPQITISQSGMFTAEISNACGVSADTLIVSPLPDIPQLMLGPDQSLCPGELLTFNPGIQDVQYLWQDGTTASSFSTTLPGLITLTISNGCGASTDSVLIIESTNGPQLDLGPDITACDGDTVTIQSGITGVVYTWQDGTANPFYQTSTDVQLMLHIANSCGEDNDTVAIHFVPPPDPDLGPDTVLCDQDVLTLIAQPDPLTTSTWQDGSHTPGYIVTSPGIYSLQQSNICGAKTDSIVVFYQSSPAPFSLGPDVILCPGESVILNAPVTMDHLLWQDGSDSTVITANAEQMYSLTISNECGISNDEVNVAIDSDIPVVQFDSMMFCPGDVLTLDASQTFDAQYIWSTGASSSSIFILLPGDYAVTVMTHCHTVSDAVNVSPDADCEPATQFFIPNIFSPNGDNVNDVFIIQFNEDAEVFFVEGDIFDRWGNHVFGSQEDPFTWDGTFDGQPMNPGVYVYKFTLVYSNGVDVVTDKVTGDVTLIK